MIGGAPYLHEESAAMGYLAAIVVRETRISELSIKETRKYRTFCEIFCEWYGIKPIIIRLVLDFITE